jgi:glycolate oxidase iron-sulfur subunit
MHTGYEPEAIRLAKKTIAAFEDCDTVAVNAAGCGSAMKDYVHLLEDDPVWADRARAFSARVHDVSEFLAARGTVAERHPVPLWIAYHDACHLAHAQGVRSEPRALLAEIPELELLEPADWEVCCGSAGLYNILEPEAAEQLGRRKAENLLATGAQAIAAGNPGCALQIAVWLKELGRPLPVYHPMEVLDASISGRRL